MKTSAPSSAAPTSEGGTLRLPAFKDLPLRVAQFYRERPAELRTQNEALVAAFDKRIPRRRRRTRNSPTHTRAPACSSRASSIRRTAASAARRTPQPQICTRLLRGLARDRGCTRTGPGGALRMVTLTLRRIADGGINDQLAGGFCRYSVDEAG
jgi:uncharacterized protein YyaL (SSP411 family)